jgi:hypothetical protein
MQTYEFSSAVEANGVIRIPEQYLPNISSPVKVIVCINDEIQSAGKKTFSAIKLKTRGFKFDRNEANER